MKPIVRLYRQRMNWVARFPAENKTAHTLGTRDLILACHCHMVLAAVHSEMLRLFNDEYDFRFAPELEQS